MILHVSKFNLVYLSQRGFSMLMLKRNMILEFIFSRTGRTRKQSPGYIALFIFFCAIYPGLYVQQVTTFLFFKRIFNFRNGE